MHSAECISNCKHLSLTLLLLALWAIITSRSQIEVTVDFAHTNFQNINVYSSAILSNNVHVFSSSYSYLESNDVNKRDCQQLIEES